MPMFYLLCSILCLVAAVVVLAGGAITAGEFWKLVRQGPIAATEARERGYSLRQWWSGRARPAQRAGTALAGRYDPEVGIVGIETDVSLPS